jgi:hypothetical protein
MAFVLVFFRTFIGHCVYVRLPDIPFFFPFPVVLGVLMTVYPPCAAVAMDTEPVLDNTEFQPIDYNACKRLGFSYRALPADRAHVCAPRQLHFNKDFTC